MNHVLGAHHTSFTVTNLDRSLAFFRDGLGLEVVVARTIREKYFDRIVGLPECEVKAALLRLPGGHHIELFEYVQPKGESVASRPCDPGSSHLALLVEDLAGLAPKLTARGANLVSPPVLIDAGPNRGAYAAYLRDPNGILIELFQPPPKQP